MRPVKPLTRLRTACEGSCKICPYPAGVPGWAHAYLGVACLLHMLWFFTALMWLAAVHLRTVHHQQDELSRAMSKQEALHVKVGCLASLVQMTILWHDHCNTLSQLQGPCA